MQRRPFARSSVLAAVLALVATGGIGCDSDPEAGDDHDHDHDHEPTEVITTVTLRFTPEGGGETRVAEFSDPDGDGGMSGSSDPIALTEGIAYDLEIGFSNALVDPTEDITAEVAEEAEEHQVFIAGTSVDGPAVNDNSAPVVMHEYADLESDYGDNAVGADLPLGLSNRVVAVAAGTGTFTVRLQHLPELNGNPQKVPDLATQLRDGMLLPGDADARVTFDLTVAP